MPVSCLRSLAVTALALGLASGPAAAEIKVAATIKPIHSLVAGVMGDTGTPALVLDGQASPHVAALRPSQARTVEEADIVFAVGEGLEIFLAKLVESRGEGLRLVELAEAPGVRLLPYRDADGEEHDEESHGHGDDSHADDHDDHAHAGNDPHVWLDPDNAAAMVRHIAAVLSEADPARAEVYRANAETLVGDLDALANEIAARLAPVKDRPFLVFHDAYQYLEARFALNGLGGVVLTPETPPGARRLKAIRHRIAEAGVACVFSEPQFDIGYVATVVEGTGARSASLDYLGVGVEAGPGAYRAILSELADNLAGCLAGD